MKELIAYVYITLSTWMPQEHAYIATQQACFESGWFGSRAYTEECNPFGLMWKGRVQTFESLDDACYNYYRQIYCNYDGCSDYWLFLNNLPYCNGCDQYQEKVSSINLNEYLK